MLYDIAVLIILAVFIIIGVYRGAAKTLLSVAAVFVSSLLTIFLSQFLSGMIFELFIRTAVENAVASAIAESGLQDVLLTASNLLRSLPALLISAMSFFGMSGDAFENFCADTLTAEGEAAATTIAAALEPTIIGILTVLLGIILFIILTFLLLKLAGALSNMFELPLVRVANYLAGGALGLVEGMLLVSLIALLLRLLLPLFPAQWNFLSTESMEGSYVFSLIYSGELLTKLQELTFGVSKSVRF